MEIVIIEDEQYIAKRLVKLLDSINFEYELLGIFGRVSKAIDWLQNNPEPDLIFADIQLLDGTSFDIFSKVKLKSYVIFTTSYDDYAIQAFQVNSIDYLLKPITKRSLATAIEKLEALQVQDSSNNISELLKQLNNEKPKYKSRFLIKVGQGMELVTTGEIAYLFMEGSLSFVRTTTGKKHCLDLSMEELETSLDPETFFRINRQMIVKIDSIKKIKTFFNSRLILTLEPAFAEDVVVTRSRVGDFKEWLGR